MTEIDGTTHYDFEDVQAGLCEPSQLWKPVPADALPPRPADATSTTPAPFSGGVPLLRSDNVAAFRQAQIEELWAAAFALRPAVLLGDRQAADSFVKIHDRLAKLSGTDAPKQNITYINNTPIGCLSDADLEQIAAGGLTLVQGPDGTFAADDESAP